MNVLVADTSSWISYFRGVKQDDLDLALKEGRVHLPSIVIAELLSGKLSAKQRKDLVSFLSDLPIYGDTFEHWVRVGSLREKLMRKGVIVSTPDAHVAQCSMDLKGYLLSEDKIFEKIARNTGLKLI